MTVVFWLNTPKYSLKVQQNTNVRFQHPSGSNPQILPPKSTPTACNFYRGVPTMVYKVSFFRKFYRIGFRYLQLVNHSQVFDVVS